MRKLTSRNEILKFREWYKKMSGFDVLLEYLELSDVYGFFRKGKMIGGFCINKSNTLRTIEVFSNASNKSELFERLEGVSIKEVTCFWLDKYYRKKPLLGMYFWHRVALKAACKSSKYVIYGTNSIGLAKVYDTPKNAFLLYHGAVENTNTYIFIARSKDVLWGLQEQMIARLVGLKNLSFPKKKEHLKKIFSYELSK